MRKIILLMHVSLDGFVAGPSGEMDWIRLSDDLWDYVTSITAESDTALYGAKTYKLMEDYWPTAAEQPDATKHDIDHGAWANSVDKYVFSKSIESTHWEGTQIIRDNVLDHMTEMKQQPGKNILMLGSRTLVQIFMQMGLLDELRLNVNPDIIGKGLRLFSESETLTKLELIDSRTFKTEVIGLTYTVIHG